MNQIAQRILFDPIWRGIAGVAVVLYGLFTAYIVIKVFRPQSSRIRILRIVLIAAVVVSFVLLVPFGGRVIARFYLLRESLFGGAEGNVPLCSRAIALDPNYAVAYTSRGFAFYYQGERERAIVDFNEALRLDPNDAYAYYGRGLAHSHLAEYEEAIADFNEALRLSPNDAWVYNSRGLAQYRQGEYEEAIADFNEALRIDPDFVSVYHNLGLALYELGDYEEAIANFEYYLQMAPPEDEAWITQSEEFIDEMRGEGEEMGPLD